jgi:hypothetical protein
VGPSQLASRIDDIFNQLGIDQVGLNYLAFYYTT